MNVAVQFPRGDANLLRWSQNVVDLITPNPGDFNLVAADVTAYAALHTSYQSALTACAPEVRNKPAVVTKNQARAALKLGAILLANKVYSSGTVSDALKVELGMPPRATPTPWPVPQTAPMLGVKSVVGWTVTVELKDAASGGKRGRPPYTAGASVFSHVGESAPVSVNDWTFEGNCGRTTVKVQFDSSLPGGTKVWLCAFWFNGKKQSGPICTAVPVTLQGGAVSDAV